MIQEVLLAQPRGFCAGVDRAIDVVLKALEVYDRPIYVRHEIVHNRHVVERLEDKGVTFVETLDEIPDNVVAILSAHGVPERVVEDAKERDLTYIDATCPLVTKVHLEAKKYYNKGFSLVLIGHEGHPEVEGTRGQIPGEIELVEEKEDVKDLPFSRDTDVAYLTQTTLSVDYTKEIIEELESEFEHVEGPSQEDICYATQNRQDAVKELADKTDYLYVLGSSNSSNTKRLVEVAQDHGVSARRIQDVSEIRESEVSGCDRIGVSAGASAPEDLVEGVVDYIQQEYPSASARNLETVDEDMDFLLPEALREAK